MTFSNCGIIILYKDAFAQLVRLCVNGTVISFSVLDVTKEKELTLSGDPRFGDHRRLVLGCIQARVI